MKHIEILKKKSSKSNDEIVDLVKNYIPLMLKDIQINVIIRDLPSYLLTLIETITFCDIIEADDFPDNVKFHVFEASDRGPEMEYLDSDNDDTEVTSSNHWILPSKEFHGLWESLIYENGLKENLLKYVETTMYFSERNIDLNIISCNRLVLLHGPPGTGKTSLSKALAQKIAIRLGTNYKFHHLIEINSHSLFSKWFSESGKLVMKLFNKIRNIIEHKSSLVCVLIDEIESIAYSRNSVSNNEPSDSLRVVNAVLTELDRIRKYPNVLILTTSNLTSTIDLAFLDRADIKQFIGHPTVEAIYNIYSMAILELIKAEIIITKDCIIQYGKLELNNQQDNIAQESKFLFLIAETSLGLSGRTLRKIPFLAHALHLSSKTASLQIYLEAMQEAVFKHIKDNKNINKI